MAGLRPGHPRLSCSYEAKTWMPGTRPGMTTSEQPRGARRLEGRDAAELFSSFRHAADAFLLHLFQTTDAPCQPAKPGATCRCPADRSGATPAGENAKNS